MTRPHDDPTIARLLGPAEPEILCEECFEQLDAYVEAELGHADADADRFPECAPTSRAAQRAGTSTRACAPWSCRTTDRRSSADTPLTPDPVPEAPERRPS